MTYRIRQHGKEFAVILARTNRPVFYAATRRACQDWIDRNGHDEWN